MLSTTLPTARDHEGFLWRGRFGSLYVKAWPPVLDLCTVGGSRTLPFGVAHRAVGFRVGQAAAAYFAGRTGPSLMLRLWSHRLTVGWGFWVWERYH